MRTNPSPVPYNRHSYKADTERHARGLCDYSVTHFKVPLARDAAFHTFLASYGMATNTTAATVLTDVREHSRTLSPIVPFTRPEEDVLVPDT